MIHESELKLEGLYQTPYNGNSHTVRYLGCNGRGTKYYFAYEADYNPVHRQKSERSIKALIPNLVESVYKVSIGL
jgi:hypothetical protein